MYIRTAMNCGAECWPIKVNDVRRVESIQIKMNDMWLDTEG